MATSPRRFQAQPQTTIRDLKGVIARMGARNLEVSQEFGTGAATIRFDRDGARYVFRCQKWSVPEDNLRAAQRAISNLYAALEEYGVTSSKESSRESFRRVFAGFLAPPDDSVLLLGGGQWWSVLGVEPAAGREEIVNAFRALAFRHHPDHGGDSEDFKRLRAAYEAGIAAQEER